VADVLALLHLVREVFSMCLLLSDMAGTEVFQTTQRYVTVNDEKGSVNAAELIN